MSLDLPKTATEVNQRSRVDIKRDLPDSDPFLKNSFIGSIVTATGNRNFDFYFALEQAQLESIPDTAVLTLEQWAAIWDILRLAAVAANGNLAIGGTAGGIIPLGTFFYC